jgi:hypothetical protein
MNCQRKIEMSPLQGGFFRAGPFPVLPRFRQEIQMTPLRAAPFL